MAASAERSGLPLTLLLTALIGAPLAWAPMLIRGLAADGWVIHYAALPSLPHPRRASARALASRVDAAMLNLAPLPQASKTALRALEIGERAQHENHDSESALVIYQAVRASCARARSRPLAGAGFAVIEARAAALESAARGDAPK